MTKATTPGPWRVGDYNPGEAAPVLTEDESVLVAEVAVQATGYDEQAANARLVAMVPALREALEKIARYQSEHDGQDFDTAFQAVEKIARGALAKLKGR